MDQPSCKEYMVSGNQNARGEMEPDGQHLLRFPKPDESASGRLRKPTDQIRGLGLMAWLLEVTGFPSCISREWIVSAIRRKSLLAEQPPPAFLGVGEAAEVEGMPGHGVVAGNDRRMDCFGNPRRRRRHP